MADIDPNNFPEASIRADRLTPEVIGRRVLVSTTEGAALSGEVVGYEIHVWAEKARTLVDPRYASPKSAVAIRLRGVENDIEIRGNSEVKVLA